MGKFAAAKATARRRVHDTMAIAAEYWHTDMPTWTPLQIRWHNRLVQNVGDLENGGYSNVMETDNRVIFDTEELSATGIVVDRGARIKILVQPGYPKEQFLLVDERDPAAMPTEEIWIVSRKTNGRFPT